MSTNPCDLMAAAWDPARLALARQIDQHAPRVGRGTRRSNT